MSESSKRRATVGEHEGLTEKGSAARTRPVSVEEIMLRRKMKKLGENGKEGSTVGAKSMGVDLVGVVSEYDKSEKKRHRHHRDSSHGSEKLRSEVNVKDGSRKKGRLDQLKNKEGHIADARKKVEGEGQSMERKMKADRDDTHVVVSKMRERGERRASKVTDKQIHGREIVSEQASRGLGNEPERKRLRSLVVMNRLSDENNGKPDDLSKRKHENGGDTRDKEKKMPQQLDLRKVHSIEGLERKAKRKQPRSHHHDTREKRRRSRSRDHGQDKHRRSSPSPRAEIAALRHRKDHEELSASGSKDWSGRHHSGDDGNKGASNGLSKQFTRHTGSKSGLGGYSPRKRRYEASLKAPSPPNLPAEKKSAKWDLPPTGTTNMLSGSVFSGLHAAMGTAYSTISEAALTMLKPLAEVSFKTPPAKQNTSIDSVQLTESTRRMRRLYVENMPDSVSEKSLVECFNSYMLSSGANYIQGTQPCLSCIINKEKGQALVEFLTPEDASSALSLDGCSFAGSSLKIRRPKDFVITTTGDLDKKEAATNVLSEIVEDSPNKIFIGGISNAISSEMLMEIVSVFGPLKAYRFAINNDHQQRCAFLEYVDGSITVKACAGLNGMKLGGSVLTVVRALPDASSIMENNKKLPLYEIPEHAKPLLGRPTNILKLKNVIDPEGLSSISEPEIKDILDDVRLECARFGMIKSVNITKHQISETVARETDAAVNLESSGSEETNVSVIREEPAGSCTAEETIAGHQEDQDQDQDQSAAPNSEQERGRDNGKEVNEAEHRQEVGAGRVVRTRWEPVNEGEEKPDLERVFEPGCIFVEYGRTEASRAAAHSLHGRLYEDRVVKVEYVYEEHYKMRFPN